jgi:hypothetical protein
MVIDLNGHIVLAGQLPTPAEATPHLSPRDEDSLSWAFSIDARRALDAVSIYAVFQASCLADTLANHDGIDYRY